jgi:transcriptional regulator with XRE-family HTH domain
MHKSDVMVKRFTKQLLPLPVERALRKFGMDIRIARLKRGFTIEMMAERIGIHRTTYSKIEKGDPMVGLGSYAAALFVLGFGTLLEALIDQRSDDTGLLLNLELLPKRVRPKKKPQAL